MSRTPDLRITRPQAIGRNDKPAKRLRDTTPMTSHPFPTDPCRTDPDLVAVVTAWDRPPGAVRAGIVAMVKAASGS